jgi:hypothetical protein
MPQRDVSIKLALSLDVSFDRVVEKGGTFEFRGKEAEMNEGQLKGLLKCLGLIWC